MLKFTKLIVFVAGSTLIGGAALATTSPIAPPPVDFVIRGAVTPVQSPAQYPGTTLEANRSIPVQSPHYYVVQGQWTGVRWVYQYAVHAAGTPVLTAPIAMNEASHTELIVAGLPGTAVWQWAEIPFSHGKSLTSQIPLHRKP